MILQGKALVGRVPSVPKVSTSLTQREEEPCTRKKAEVEFFLKVIKLCISILYFTFGCVDLGASQNMIREKHAKVEFLLQVSFYAFQYSILHLDAWI